MATPRSITVVHAGLSGAFDKTFPQISSSGTYNHQGMPYRPRDPELSHPNRAGGVLCTVNPKLVHSGV